MGSIPGNLLKTLRPTAPATPEDQKLGGLFFLRTSHGDRLKTKTKIAASICESVPSKEEMDIRYTSVREPGVSEE